MVIDSEHNRRSCYRHFLKFLNGILRLPADDTRSLTAKTPIMTSAPRLTLQDTAQAITNAQRKVEASVARCLRTPLVPATEQDLNWSNHTAIKQRGELPHSCHLQLVYQPDNGGTMPGKRTIFTPLSILFRPHHKPDKAARKTRPNKLELRETPPGTLFFNSLFYLTCPAYGGGAGYRPRVQWVYYIVNLLP